MLAIRLLRWMIKALYWFNGTMILYCLNEIFLSMLYSVIYYSLFESIHSIQITYIRMQKEDSKISKNKFFIKIFNNLKQKYAFKITKVIRLVIIVIEKYKRIY